MSMMPGAPAAIQAEFPKVCVFNLNQAAGTYNLATATGDVWVEVIGSYVKTAAAGLTSAALVTDHATPKTVVAAVLLASLTVDAVLTVVAASFLLPSGKHLQGTIVGTGSGGEIDLYVRYTPMSAGATLT